MKLISIICLMAVAALAQPLLPPSPVITPLPTIDYGQNGYVIQHWLVNGKEVAIQITTNWILSSNQPAKFTLVTNKMVVYQTTNGHSYAAGLLPTPPPANPKRQGYVVRGLYISTDLKNWSPVGFETKGDRLFIKTQGPLSLQLTNL